MNRTYTITFTCLMALALVLAACGGGQGGRQRALLWQSWSEPSQPMATLRRANSTSRTTADVWHATRPAPINWWDRGLPA